VVLIVGNEPGVVEADLRSGKLACPHCGADLRPWGSARSRTTRLAVGVERHRPPRGRCRGCNKTSVLLSERFFARRADEAALIGEALFAKASGSGQRAVAVRTGRARETVRNWFARFARRAAELSRHFVAWALALDARLHEVPPQGSGFADAVEALALAARAASTCFGPKPVWSWASRMTAGGLLANTTWPYPAPP
jgi:transposase-like protein